MRVKVDICRITYGFLNMEPLDAVGDVKQLLGEMVGISDFTLCFFKGSGGGVVFPDDAFTLVDLGAEALSTFKLYTHKPLPHVFKAMEVVREKQDSCRNGYVSAVHDFKDGTVITAEGIFFVSHGLHLDNESSFKSTGTTLKQPTNLFFEPPRKIANRDTQTQTNQDSFSQSKHLFCSIHQ